MHFTLTGLMLVLGLTCGALGGPVAISAGQVPGIEARMPATEIACPAGLHCGPGPVCSVNDCKLCPNFPGCPKATKERREAADDFLPPTCDICDASGNCGCGTIYKNKGQAEKRTVHPVCDICDSNGNCGCGAVHPDKREATVDILPPTCDICDAQGNCGCGAIYKDKHHAEKRIINPICDICDAKGNCGCGAIFKEKREAEAATHPICQVCTASGCACQAGPPKTPAHL